MSIFLIRHGETDLNATRVLQWPDTPLGERGRAQARALGVRFAGQRPAAIVSSDMARARETADAIARATGLPVLESALLQERNFGELRGRRFDDLGYDPIEAEGAPPGGETMAAFRDRVARAREWVRGQREAAGGDLLVVSHGLVIREWLAWHAHFPEGLVPPHRLSNTSVSILDAEPPHTVRLLDCSAHLEAAVRDDGKGVAGI